MLYLLATIIFNTVLFVFFKLFPRFGVNNLQAIVANYWTCVVTGSLFMGELPVGQGSINEEWLPWAALMGAMFFVVFNLLAYCTRKDGMTTATVANKLSLVIPVVFSVFLYSEHLSAVKIAGILIAFPAVYLTTKVEEGGKKSQDLLWPALIFIGSGLLDTMVKFIEHSYIGHTGELISYTIHVFVAAGTAGLVAVAVQAISGEIKLHTRNLIAGIILGVPNYFSIYYLMQFLKSDIMQSSAAIPVTNIGIVLLSALTAIVFFRERITRPRVIGLILSILAILLIALGDMNGTGI